MTEKEKKEFYIANCKCCLLADAMKTCPVCRFNIGLAQKADLAGAIPVSFPVQTPTFALSENI